RQDLHVDRDEDLLQGVEAGEAAEDLLPRHVADRRTGARGEERHGGRGRQGGRGRGGVGRPGGGPGCDAYRIRGGCAPRLGRGGGGGCARVDAGGRRAGGEGGGERLEAPRRAGARNAVDLLEVGGVRPPHAHRRAGRCESEGRSLVHRLPSDVGRVVEAAAGGD